MKVIKKMPTKDDECVIGAIVPKTLRAKAKKIPLIWNQLNTLFQELTEKIIELKETTWFEREMKVYPLADQFLMALQRYETV